MIIFFRWILALVASALGFCITFFVTMFVGSAFESLIVRSFCPSEQIVSGSCLEPQWVNVVGRGIPMLVGAGLAAGLVVLFGALAAPSRRAFVPWIFYAIGAIVAVFMLSTETYGPGCEEFLSALAAFVSGAVVAARLNRAKFPSSSALDA